jgi:uncharacterized membrane protein YraQ (UPF0718 family)
MTQVTTPGAVGRDRRVILTALLIAILAGAFWTGSRYPDLNRKAAVGGDMGVTGLAFDIVAKSTAQDPLWKRIGAATLNWIETNKKGMTFGLLMAAAILTLLSLLSRRSVENPLANSLLGAAIGAPMGLCVNCATPIATAMHRGGTRLETSLATLVSSPTLNVIVLTMLMSLFPWYLWVPKVAATAALALFGVPLLTYLFFGREVAAQAASLPPEALASPRFALPSASTGLGAVDAYGWWRGTLWLIRTFAIHLWWLVRTAVPLMLLAGLLGSAIITLAPWDTLERFSIMRGGLSATLATMAIFAVVATFLPVPMAFDVIVSAILFERGLPSYYTMVLLFALGTYSVYPFLMLRKAVSLRVASVLFLAVCGVAFVCGAAVRYLEKWHFARQEAIVSRTLLAEPAAPAPPLPQSPAAADDRTLAAMLGVPVAPAAVDAGDRGLTIERVAFQPSSGSGPSLFTRTDGWKIGLDVPALFSPRKFMLRSAEVNRPIASGDVHGDGWPDLLIGADHDIGGLLLFANIGGKKFVRQRVELGALGSAMVQTAALVDLNGDGWLDIFFTTFAEGNYAVLNRQGTFPDAPILISRDPLTLANAAAFGDVNRDGRLDLVVGNWTMGREVSRGTPKAAADHVLVSQGGMKYAESGLEGSPGYTLSTLLTDFTGDGVLDLIVGNDFEPDSFYVGDGKGGFRRLLRADHVIPATGLNTMSLASADIDNDAIPELFTAQIAIGSNRRAMLARRVAPADAVAQIERPQDREGLQRAVRWWPVVRRLRASEDIGAVTRIDDPWTRQQFACFGTVLIAMRRGTREWVNRLPQHCGASEYMTRVFSETYSPTREEAARRIPAAMNGGINVLLKADGRGGFVDRTTEFNLGITDWTWNARFADVDNDGRQDLYAATGWARQDGWESNVFLRNSKAGAFRNDTRSAGLEDYLPTSGYTYVDFDRDGDLDIVSVPVLGPLRVFVNNSQRTRALDIELRDGAGNAFGLGSRIVIHYGSNGELQQMRELQAGGGYVSYDAPVAHFGLGDHDTVGRVEIRWSTGETTTIDRPLAAGFHYVIRRPRSGAVR